MTEQPYDSEEANESPVEKENESEVDEDAIVSYLDSLSDEECHFAYEHLKQKYEGQEENKKMSMEDIAQGK